MDIQASRGALTRTQLVEVKLDDGTTFYVKMLASSGETAVDRSKISFEEAVEAIEGIGKRLTQVWETVKPSRASVELGVDFTCQAGKAMAVLVDGSATASMKITLEWNRESEKESK